MSGDFIQKLNIHWNRHVQRETLLVDDRKLKETLFVMLLLRGQYFILCIPGSSELQKKII